jgi:hypothetical protein
MNIQVSFAATPSISRTANPIISKMNNPLAKTWAKSRIKFYNDTLRDTTRLYENPTDIKLFREDISRSAMDFLSDIKSGSYTFDITDADRKNVESTILWYQKDFVKTLRNSIEQIKNHDTRQTGDLHFIVRSKDMNIDLNIDPYRIVQTKDNKNIELDARITLQISEWTSDELRVSVDGNILIIWEDLYITLRDYSLDMSFQDRDYLEIENILKTTKGKTYHQKLDENIVYGLQNSQWSFEMIEKFMKLLETESLLTPIAKHKQEYILMFRKATIAKITDLDRIPDIADIEFKDLIIPIDLRLTGSTIQLNGYMDNVAFDATIQRHIDGTPIMTINWQEHGTTDMWKWKISKTPFFWALAGSSDQYSVDAQASSNGATAMIKDGGKTIATAKIDSTGINAWTYDLSATWQDIKTDWETGKQESEEIAVRLWGTIKDEFGAFTLTPPSIYEEMSKLEEQLR